MQEQLSVISSQLASASIPAKSANILMSGVANFGFRSRFDLASDDEMK
jgi:hypothetical protein